MDFMFVESTKFQQTELQEFQELQELQPVKTSALQLVLYKTLAGTALELGLDLNLGLRS